MSRFLDFTENDIDELIHDLSLGIYVFNSDARILDANPVFLQIFGASSTAELEAQKAGELLQLRSLAEAVDLSSNNRVIQEFEMQIPGKDRVHNILNIVRASRDVPTGKIYYRAALVEVNDRMVFQSPPPPEGLRDSLTGSFSQVYLGEFEREFDEHLWGCIVVHMDHFRQYRDRYGSELAQHVLVRMSRFLMRHIRAEDAVVKLSGEQFVILLGSTEISGVQRVVRRLTNAALAQAPTSFSLGAAVRMSQEGLIATIQRADQSLSRVRVLERPPKRLPS
jgi:diguanylate cyclase (GGDEF)-like protein